MEKSITNFVKQFTFEPEIINSEKFPANKDVFVLGGMGGSHLAAGIFQLLHPEINLSIHRDYGLPNQSAEMQKHTLYIASSYSGTTEEILDFADEAYSKGLDLIIITTGGKLLTFAQENHIPAIIFPNDGIQPRVALGYSLLALYKIILPEEIKNVQDLQHVINPQVHISQAQELSQAFFNKIPVIYSSSQNRAIAYNWKIKCNETAKIPAFYNSFPELNHNEMQGYDFTSENAVLSEKFHFVFIHDRADEERVEKRMQITEQLYQEKGLTVTSLFLEGETKLAQIFNSLLLADWTALELAKLYKTESEKVPLIEKFKKLL